MQDDHRDGHQGAGHEQLRAVGGDDHADDQQDGHLRNDRQGDRDLLDLLAEDYVADHTEGNREEHHLDGVKEQGLSRHGHVLRSEQLHQQTNRLIPSRHTDEHTSAKLCIVFTCCANSAC